MKKKIEQNKLRPRNLVLVREQLLYVTAGTPGRPTEDKGTTCEPPPPPPLIDGTR